MVIQYPTHACGLFYFFLFIFIHGSSCSIKIIGYIGHNVTLPCRYDAQTHGDIGFCWGQEAIPISKCSNTILSSQSGHASNREPSKYHLQGPVTEGELSLTILNAQKSDEGTYGCRVEIPGWFNDQKIEMYLVMIDAPEIEKVTEPWRFSPAITEEKVRISAQKKQAVGEGSWKVETFFITFGMSNIIKILAVFCFTVILIFILVTWRASLSREKLQHPGISENIYESI